MPFPTLQAETVKVSLQFALLLRDAFANSDELLGDVSVACGSIQARRKDSSGTFLYFTLRPGALTFKVTSSVYTPYYLPTSLPITVPLPSPLWPAFPDQTLADPSLPLGDAGQTVAYKAQRAAAALLPSTAYPFPPGATLIRGTVSHGGAPQAAAVVQVTGSTDPAYTTGPDGQFVLYVSAPSGLPQAVTVNAAQGASNANVDATVVRGQTVSVNIAI